MTGMSMWSSRDRSIFVRRGRVRRGRSNRPAGLSNSERIAPCLAPFHQRRHQGPGVVLECPVDHGMPCSARVVVGMVWARRALAVFAQPVRRNVLRMMLRRAAMTAGVWWARTWDIRGLLWGPEGDPLAGARGGGMRVLAGRSSWSGCKCPRTGRVRPGLQGTPDAIAVLDAAGADHRHQGQPQCAGDNEPPMAIGLLLGVVADCPGRPCRQSCRPTCGSRLFLAPAYGAA